MPFICVSTGSGLGVFVGFLRHWRKQGNCPFSTIFQPLFGQTYPCFFQKENLERKPVFKNSQQPPSLFGGEFFSFLGSIRFYSGHRRLREVPYKEEIEDGGEVGGLRISTTLTTSREGGKTYVTEEVAKDALVLQEEVEKGGLIYLCGNPKMIQDVCNTLRKVLTVEEMKRNLVIEEWV